jgi:hypothetical protein
VPKTRKKRIPVQAKSVQRAIMDVILKEIEVEKRNQKKELPSNASERAISYGVVDKVIKKHKEANPWLTRDSLNNYQRLKGGKALNSDGGSIPKTISAGKTPKVTQYQHYLHLLRMIELPLQLLIQV